MSEVKAPEQFPFGESSPLSWKRDGKTLTFTQHTTFGAYDRLLAVFVYAADAERALQAVTRLPALVKALEEAKATLKNVSDECAGIIALHGSGDLEDQSVLAAVKPIKRTVDAALAASGGKQ